MPKKLKLTKPTANDASYTPDRITVGNTRVTAAMEHLARAREQLDAACRDLSDVYGASDFHRAISSASNTARDATYLMEEGIEKRYFAAASSSAKTNEPKHQSCGGAPALPRQTGARY